MTNFVFAYRGGSGMATTPEAQEKVMAAWGAWFGTLGADLVEGGAPFGATTAMRYVVYLTIGYLVSRGLAKSGSREGYNA